MKVKKILSILREEGWYVARFRGSHRQLKNKRIPGTVTVAGHLSQNIHPKILTKICQQAQLTNSGKSSSPQL